jgi:putative oxidoreductase
VPVAILAGVFLLVAAWASWKFSEGKWIWNFGGGEYPLFWGICCFVVAMQAWRM